MGRVKNLFIKPARGEPMNAVRTAVAVSGMGLEGDASYGRRSRQVLLMDCETLVELGLRPGDARENITLEGYSLADLSSGDRLAVGEVELAVTGPCEPCSKLDALGPNLSSEFQGRRGVLAVVVRSGELRVDDQITQVGSELSAARTTS